MVELQLFQGRQRAIALLREFEPAALELIGLAKPVFRGRDPGRRRNGSATMTTAATASTTPSESQTLTCRMLVAVNAVQASGAAVARRAGTR